MSCPQFIVRPLHDLNLCWLIVTWKPLNKLCLSLHVSKASYSPMFQTCIAFIGKSILKMLACKFDIVKDHFFSPWLYKIYIYSNYLYILTPKYFIFFSSLFSPLPSLWKWLTYFVLPFPIDGILSYNLFQHIMVHGERHSNIYIYIYLYINHI